MKKKAMCALLLAMLSGGFAYADTEQTVLVNGAPVDGFVTELAFSGDNVIMTFDDASTQTEDMSLVSIELAYNDGSEIPPTGIDGVEAGDANAVKRVYTISGQYVGTSTEGLPAGLYIVNGKKQIIK